MKLSEKTRGAETMIQSKLKNHPSVSISEDYLQKAERYYGHSIPEPWRSTLLRIGSVPKMLSFGGGKLTLDPMIAAEDEVETEDGKALHAAGMVVIGYVEETGDRIVITLDEAINDDPAILFHSHGTGGLVSLGTMSHFLQLLANQLNSDTSTL
jgi:hypothetical protein